MGSSDGSGGGAGGMKCPSCLPARAGGGALRARILRARVPCAAVRRSAPRRLDHIRFRGPWPSVRVERPPHPLIVKPSYPLYPARPVRPRPRPVRSGPRPSLAHLLPRALPALLYPRTLVRSLRPWADPLAQMPQRSLEPPRSRNRLAQFRSLAPRQPPASRQFHPVPGRLASAGPARSRGQARVSGQSRSWAPRTGRPDHATPRPRRSLCSPCYPSPARPHRCPNRSLPPR